MSSAISRVRGKAQEAPIKKQLEINIPQIIKIYRVSEGPDQLPRQTLVGRHTGTVRPNPFGFEGNWIFIDEADGLNDQIGMAEHAFENAVRRAGGTITTKE